jgi:hypothetical protein
VFCSEDVLKKRCEEGLVKKAVFEEGTVRRAFFDDGVLRALCGLRWESKNASGKGNCRKSRHDLEKLPHTPTTSTLHGKGLTLWKIRGNEELETWETI